jgi:hypothetical protein
MLLSKTKGGVKIRVCSGYFENQPLNKAQEALENIMDSIGMHKAAAESRKRRLEYIQEQYRRYNK